jgi:ATP-dependent RNA helicase RhlE
MSFKKLQEDLVIDLKKDGITEFWPAQEKIFSKVREGKNLIVVSEGEKGISTLLSIISIFKVPEPQEGSPRVVLICANNEEAVKRHEELSRWGRHLDLTIDLLHERGNKIQQRNDIFDGTEIVVGTAKRIYDMYIQNGLNLNMIRLFAIDDATKVLVQHVPTYLARLGESLPKCQMIIGTKEVNPKLADLMEKLPFVFQKVKMD